MMNVALLAVGSLLTGNATLLHMALAHGTRTMQEHVRADGSTYHVVEYNETSGAVLRKYTQQGYADNSTWARGQAWCTYGFTQLYGLTRHTAFLSTARRCADYFLARLAQVQAEGREYGYVPYWDFDAPHTATYQPRDSSAAAIVASGLLELADYVDAKAAAEYRAASQGLLANLTASDIYVSNAPWVQLPAVLINGTVGPHKGPQDAGRTSDIGLVYGEHYLTEALLRTQARQRGWPLSRVTPSRQHWLRSPTQAAREAGRRSRTWGREQRD